jgi:DNA-binding CsgD family transcriptional regulator
MNKSKLYQHKIVEISFDSGKLNNFPNERGIGHIMAENETNEKIADLKETLMEEIYDVVHGEFLTDHQKKILMMRLTGKTQNEIAEHLGITQSAVHKAMHGNIDYKNNKKRYGGIIKKLRKICKINPNIQKILGEIDEIKNEKEV